MATAVRKVWCIMGAPARRRVFAALEPRGSGLAEVPPTRPQPCLPASLPEGSLMAPVLLNACRWEMPVQLPAVWRRPWRAHARRIGCTPC